MQAETRTLPVQAGFSASLLFLSRCQISPVRQQRRTRRREENHTAACALRGSSSGACVRNLRLNESLVYQERLLPPGRCNLSQSLLKGPRHLPVRVWGPWQPLAAAATNTVFQLLSASQSKVMDSSRGNWGRDHVSRVSNEQTDSSFRRGLCTAGGLIECVDVCLHISTCCCACRPRPHCCIYIHIHSSRIELQHKDLAQCEYGNLC